MAKDLTTIGVEIAEKAKAQDQDMFGLTGSRLERLRTINQYSKVAGASQTSAATETRRKNEAEVKRSKNGHLKAAADFWNFEAYSDNNSTMHYGEFDLMVNPMAFLMFSPHGKLLRETLLHEPMVSSKILHQIIRSAELTVGRAQNDVMIQRPFHAYMDMRTALMDRLLKTQAFNKLIQKQERLLQRIGTTMDFTLLRADKTQDPELTMFCTHWSNHVQHMHRNSGTARYTAPACLTVQMFETLICLCDAEWLRDNIADGLAIRNHIYAIHPFKQIAQEIEMSAIKKDHSRFFK